MPAQLLDIDAFRSAGKGGKSPDATVYRFATTDPQQVQGASRTMRFVFSDATIDLAGDSIDPKGWNLTQFRRNPVALFSHDSAAPPIGKAANVHVVNDKLLGDIQFAGEDVYPFANTIFQLVKGGFLNAVSVGFKPDDWAFSTDRTRPNGINFKKQTLLEISVCAVPCNPSALIEARRAGLDTRPLKAWAEGILDADRTGPMSVRDLEALRRHAAEPANRRTTRGASMSDHPLMTTIDDVGASIGTTRRAIADVKATLASSDEPQLNEVQLQLAVGHFAGAITSNNNALACIRAALASAEGDDEPNPPSDLASRGVAQRTRHAQQVKRSIAALPAQTPEERLQEARALKRSIARSEVAADIALSLRRNRFID